MDNTKNGGPAKAREPVTYVTTEKSLVGNEIFEAGAEVRYAGLPAENLTPTCDEGRARAREYIESNAARVRAMQAQHTESAVGDPSVFMASFMKVQAEDQAKAAERQAEASARQAEMIGAAVASAVVQAMAAFFPNGVPSAPPAALAVSATEAKPVTKGKGADKDADLV